MPQIEIITIGDEILIGQIVDTNSAWMAAELNKAGFEVAQITSVHDNEAHITEALDNALERADIVLFTGGIGPTKDDITKQTLCKYFGTQLVFSKDVYRNVEAFLASCNRSMNDLNKSQAMVPEHCKVIQNKAGTAPITWFDKNEKVVVSMPGVPYEMKQVMTDEIIPRLQQQFKTPVIIHRTLIVQGYPESELALKIEDWENALPANIHLAYLPNHSLVKLRLSGVSEDGLSLEFAINQQIASLTNLLGNAIIAFDDLPLEEQIGQFFSAHQLTLSTAESCTGGNIAHLITTISGSSAYFNGSVVAYSNEVKNQVLGVSADDIREHGAVSSQVVVQMAEGVRRLLHTDFGVATSGIAGPTGGTPEKPVGTVWIAVSSPAGVVSRVFHFSGSRQLIIDRSTQAALLLLKEIAGNFHQNQ
jgi:nicotinamide-nucleotide amidase